MSGLLFLLLLLLLLLAGTLPGSVQAIRIVEMQVPTTVEVGKTVRLACRFDLEGANLYSLNWWRGTEQFFQYSPSSKEKIIVYDSPGIIVDKGLSGREAVVLQNVSHASAGRYKCEVLADYPSFEKHSETMSMAVIEVPSREPKMFLSRLQWSPGEVLRANCTAPPVRPPSNLHWYINGKMVSPQKFRTVTKEAEPPGRLVGVVGAGGGQQHQPHQQQQQQQQEEQQYEQRQLAITSQLTLTLKAQHFTAGGQAKLSCEASHSDVYRKVAEKQLVLPGYKTAAPSQKLFGGGARMGAGGGGEVAALLLGLAVLRLL